MEKIKQYKYIILIVLIILELIFYWYEYRPAQIKKECSWSERYIDAVQELTREQIDENVVNYKKCIANSPSGNTWDALNWKAKCGTDQTRWKPQEASPAKTFYQPASLTEYSSCLHQRGL